MSGELSTARYCATFFSLRNRTNGERTNSEEQQRTRLRRLHGRHVDLVLSVGYVPQEPVVPETRAVRELPGKGRKVHDADRISEGVESAQERDVERGARVEHDVSTHVEKGLGVGTHQLFKNSRVFLLVVSEYSERAG